MPDRLDTQRIARIAREADVLRALHEHGELSASEVQRYTGLTSSLARQTLQRLTGQRVVISRTVGKGLRWKLP